jgi:2,4-dienoyl-CoA reductase-like NADH-dependent reductase (Old Yellow Enzyme family)
MLPTVWVESQRMGEDYTHVLQPFQLGPVALPNRLVRTAHGTGLASSRIGPELIAFHLARARGGVGLTILEATSVHPSGNSPTGMRSWDDSAIAGYEALRTALAGHQMRLMAQLFHGGYTAPPVDGGAPWSASAIPAPDSGIVAVAMSEDQIAELIEAFAAAARRAVAGGLDGIEIHAGHGYLIGQFLSALTNRRDDRYGGSPENRGRLLAEILQAVRREVPQEIPVGVRVSASDEADGGQTVADTTALVIELAGARMIDFLDVSLGSRYAYHRVIGGMEQPRGYELELATPVTRAVSVPTIVAGRITTLAQADEIIRSGQADLVSITRATIADPDLVVKSRRGHGAQVRPCIACNDGCVGGLHGPEHRVGCTVNPRAGREHGAQEIASPAQLSGQIMVLGGGPSGMEAARVAAQAGAAVALYEATAELGGQLRLARRAPHRSEIGKIADWLEAELHRLGVDVHLGQAISPHEAAELSSGPIVVATGSRPRRDGRQTRRPAIVLEGTGLRHVGTSWDVFEGTHALGRDVLVFDDVGHYEAIAVVEKVIAAGDRATLATSLPRLGARLEYSHVDEAVKRRLTSERFSFMPDVALHRITESSVELGSVWGDDRRSLPADAVVLVCHNEASGQPFRDVLRSRSHVAGDAVSPRFLTTAIAEGQRAAIEACRALVSG